MAQLFIFHVTVNEGICFSLCFESVSIKAEEIKSGRQCSTNIVSLLTMQIPEQQQLEEFVLWSTTYAAGLAHIWKSVS